MDWCGVVLLVWEFAGELLIWVGGFIFGFLLGGMVWLLCLVVAVFGDSVLAIVVWFDGIAWFCGFLWGWYNTVMMWGWRIWVRWLWCTF